MNRYIQGNNLSNSLNWGLPGEIMIDQLEETQGKVIFCLPETVEKLLTHTGLPIVVIPDGETEALPEVGLCIYNEEGEGVLG